MQNELRPLLSDENQLAVVFAVAGDMSDHPPERVAAYIGGSVGTLSNWRNLGGGPKFRKVGGKVMYRKKDVLAWIEENPAVSSLLELSELYRSRQRASMRRAA